MDENVEKYGPVIRLWLLLAFLLLSLLIFLVSYPSLRESDKANSEAAAISALRTISSAEELYNTRYGVYGGLEQLGRAGMIDSVLVSASNPSSPKSGYVFILALNREGDDWSCISRPAQWSVTGTRNFKIDLTGIIYYNTRPCSAEWTKALGS